MNLYFYISNFISIFIYAWVRKVIILVFTKIKMLLL